MEAITGHNVEVIGMMHWEGIDFQLLAPEITFERANTSSVQGKQRPRVTAKQKKLIEAERYTHTLP